MGDEYINKYRQASSRESPDPCGDGHRYVEQSRSVNKRWGAVDADVGGWGDDCEPRRTNRSAMARIVEETIIWKCSRCGDTKSEFNTYEE